MVGSYRVERCIGQGGMGRVYEGLHPHIGSRVAIKVLTRDVAANPQVVRRFFEEARSVNVIRHENIVNVLDLATLPDGRPFILMELLDGESLAGRIATRGALPAREVVRIATQVLDALGAAHEQGIVHRDIKPDNIFVTKNGRAKVLDFGIAKLLPPGPGGGGVAATSTGVLGTPQYMAPEQAAGGRVDHRTDLYALGLVLYEALTGRRAFEGDSLYTIIKQQVECMPQPLRSLVSDLPEALDQALLRALAKQPDDRFADAASFRAALVAAVGIGDSDIPLAPTPFEATAIATAHTVVGTPDDIAGAAPVVRVTPPQQGAARPVAPAQAVTPRGATPSTLRGLEGDAADRSEARSGPAVLALVAALVLALGVGGAGWWVMSGRKAFRDRTSVASTSQSSVETASVTASSSRPPDQPARLGAEPNTAGDAPQTQPLEPSFEPGRFDAVAYAPLALGHASKLLPDPQLALLHALQVGEGGLVDLNGVDGKVTYLFRRGEDASCVAVIVSGDGVTRRSDPGGCGNHLPTRLPSCTLPHAVANVTHGMRLPTGLSGELSFLVIRGVPRWRMKFASGFTREVDDGC